VTSGVRTGLVLAGTGPVRRYKAILVPARLTDASMGVVDGPPDLANCVSLPAVAFSLVVEILPEDEAGDWYARQGIPAYWIVDQASDRDEVDAHVQILRLKPGQAEYVPERSLLLSELEVEYSANR
jgi:hypothetical protein